VADDEQNAPHPLNRHIRLSLRRPRQHQGQIDTIHTYAIRCARLTRLAGLLMQVARHSALTGNRLYDVPEYLHIYRYAILFMQPYSPY